MLRDIAARRFEFTKDGASAGEKRLPRFRQPHGTAKAIEQPGAKFILQLHDLLRKGRLGNVRLLGGAAGKSRFRRRREKT